MPENRLIKNRIWMVGLIIIVSGISAGLLTAINLGTRDRIALNEEIKLKRSVLNVFDIDYSEGDVIDIFNKRIEASRIGARPVYEYRDMEKISGVAFEMKGSGFWGPIYALVALEPDLTAIKGIEILHQEETPGLGGRITEDEFKDQFKGKPVDPEISIDAITGATMTSKAFKKMINENVRSFKADYSKYRRTISSE
ncbi:MAG: FMN-binding protein [Candidatus Omnitrophota bacterium]